MHLQYFTVLNLLNWRLFALEKCENFNKTIEIKYPSIALIEMRQIEVQPETLSRKESDANLTQCYDVAVEHHTKAVAFLATCFCAGVPIRHALDATSQRYGNAAWGTLAAQRELVHATHGLEERLRRIVDGFALGDARCARFTRLLLDEVDHCGGVVDEELAIWAAALCCAHGVRDSSRWVALQIAGAGGFGFARIDADPVSGKGAAEGETIALRVADALSHIGEQVWEAGAWVAAALGSGSCALLSDDVRGRTVLELGAGTGVCASALKRAGVLRAYATDLPAVVGHLHRNIATNGADDIVTAAPLDARDPTVVRACAHRWCADTLLVADLAYDTALARAVVAAVAAALRGSARVAWFVVVRRNPASHDALPAVFLSHRLASRPLRKSECPPRPLCLPHCDWDSITAWRLHDAADDINIIDDTA